MGGDLLVAISRRQEIYDVWNLKIQFYFNEEISLYWSAVAAFFHHFFCSCLCLGTLEFLWHCWRAQQLIVFKTVFYNYKIMESFRLNTSIVVLLMGSLSKTGLPCLVIKSKNCIATSWTVQYIDFLWFRREIIRLVKFGKFAHGNYA